MRQSVINSIMKPHRTRGESKYMLEEIYFSDLCGDIENKDDNGAVIGINPQKAWFNNGFRFQFPNMWYQTTCNNKAIGLRSIELVPDSVSFTIKVQFYRRNTEQSEYEAVGRSFLVIQQFLPNASLMEIMSSVTQCIQAEKSRISDLKNLPFRVLWTYNYKTNQAAFAIDVGGQVTDKEKYTMKFEVFPTDERASQCGFYECFNTTEEYMNTPKYRFEFSNVWNRRDIFVHASFVNGTSFQFLGRNGEFYPKPSKMYRSCHMMAFIHKNTSLPVSLFS